MLGEKWKVDESTSKKKKKIMNAVVVAVLIKVFFI